MLNHGVSTGGLFMIVGMLSDRRHTRLISEFGGLKAVMPRFVAAFLLVTLSSIALPGMNGFVGEFLILLGGFLWNPKFAALAASGVILSAVYMLWMFQRVNYGEVTNAKNASLPDLLPREWALMVPTIAMAIVMGVLPNVFLRPMEPAVEATIERVTGRSYAAIGLAIRRRTASRLPVACEPSNGMQPAKDDPCLANRAPRSRTRECQVMADYAASSRSSSSALSAHRRDAGRGVPAARRAHADRRLGAHRPRRRGDRVRASSGTATRTASASSAPTISRSSSTSSSASSALLTMLLSNDVIEREQLPAGRVLRADAVLDRRHDADGGGDRSARRSSSRSKCCRSAVYVLTGIRGRAPPAPRRRSSISCSAPSRARSSSTASPSPTR